MNQVEPKSLSYINSLEGVLTPFIIPSFRPFMRKSATGPLVLSNITSTTLPEEFEELRKKTPDYALLDTESGENIIFKTSRRLGNHNLLRHILKTNEAKVFNLINCIAEWLYTPLMLTASCENRVEGYLTAKTLIEFEANVNFFNMEGYTNLSFVCSKQTGSCNMAIAMLLIKKGAKAYESIEFNKVCYSFLKSHVVKIADYSEVQENIAKVEATFQRYSFVKLARKAEHSIFHIFPKDISRLICGYIIFDLKKF
ncbi:MAG: hypothetical protein H0W50_03505 [Parachlamydiaceae bacterium]|nr:hypothetical protein [Parachlamydiaceae bacterium]